MSLREWICLNAHMCQNLWSAYILICANSLWIALLFWFCSIRHFAPVDCWLKSWLKEKWWTRMFQWNWNWQQQKLNCAEGAHALASAYQKLFRRHTHLEQSYPAPQAECKASSEDSWLAFLITNPARTGKYDWPGRLAGLYKMAEWRARVQLWCAADPRKP